MCVSWSSALSIALRRLPQTSAPFTAALCGFGFVLAKEVIEVFIEPGTGAVSDAGAALLGASVGYFCWNAQPFGLPWAKKQH